MRHTQLPGLITVQGMLYAQVYLQMSRQVYEITIGHLGRQLRWQLRWDIVDYLDKHSHNEGPP